MTRTDSLTPVRDGLLRAGRVEGVSFDVWMTLIASNPAFKPARSRHTLQTTAPIV